MDADVLVLGGGIAGLSAAWTLQAHGKSCLVLEAAEQPGGRMLSRAREGRTWDLGAQFLSTGYTVLPELARAVQVPLRPLDGQHSAIWRGGRWHRLPAKGFPGLGPPPLMGLGDWARLGWGSVGWWPSWGRLPLNQVGPWAPFDQESAHDWLQAKVGGQVEAALMEPLLEGLYFLSPEASSKALLAMVLAFGWRGHQLLAPEGGMGAIALALAARLPVRLGTQVLGLEVGHEQVQVQTTSGPMSAPQVICALPAWAAGPLWPQAPALEQSLLATPYSRGLLWTLALAPGHPLPPELDGVYGLLVPRIAGLQVAAVALEHQKHPDRSPEGPLLQVMLRDSAAASWLEASPEALLTALAPELNQLLPGAVEALIWHEVHRWPQAMPHFPVGHAQRIARYRATAQGPLLLAGDHMGAPFSEAAAESGRWAALRLLGMA